jgi:hypothetical protein
MALVTIEVTFAMWLIKDFDVSVSMLTPLLSDSIGAVSIARDSVRHEFTKHIGVDAYYTRSSLGWCHYSTVCVFRAPVDRFLHEGSDLHPPSALPLQTQCS